MLSTLVVDNNPADQAPYTTIQAAVNAAKSGDTISVAPGIYTEQVTVPVVKSNLTIVSQQLGAAKIKAPATLTGAPDIVHISAKAVTLENFTISGPSKGIEAGVRIDSGGSATVRGNLITQIYGSISGAGQGTGVLIKGGNGTIADNTITQYEKAGIVADGASSSAEIAGNSVVGVGPTDVIGQNGIQISRGARGNIVNNDISQNIFSPQTYVAAGILLFDAAPTTVVANTATQNDVGILVSGTKGATLFNNDLSDSTFDGIELRDGTMYTVVSSNYSHDNQLDGIYIDATATNNTITRNVLMRNGGTPQIPSIGTIYDSLTYGTTLGSAINPPLIQDANGHTVPGKFVFKNGPTDVTDTVLNVGHYDLSVTFNPDDTIDYSSVTTTASIDITKAKIVIVADSYEKTYGDANPTLTDTIYADLGPFTDPSTGQTGEAYTPLGPDDLASVAYSNALGDAPAASTDADLFANAGNHDINPTQISDGGAGTASHEFLNNFDVTYEGGTLTISPRALAVTANDATKTYGDAVTFAGTEFTTNGLVNGDSVSGVTLTSAGAAATAQVSGSPYAIVASGATGSGLANYTISYANGNLTVSPRALAVTANNTTMILGGPVPTFSAYYIGFVNGDSVSNLGNLGSLTFTPVNTTVQGTTAIRLNGSLTSSNYTIAYNPGTLTVTASKPIIIGLPPSQKK